MRLFGKIQLKMGNLLPCCHVKRKSAIHRDLAVLAKFCIRFDIYIRAGVCYPDKRYVDEWSIWRQPMRRVFQKFLSACLAVSLLAGASVSAAASDALGEDPDG